MVDRLAFPAAFLLAVLCLAGVLPAAYDKVFRREIGPPLLFFSPGLNQFIFRQSLGGHSFTYHDETGREYDRAGFEALLPFFYAKNLERQNLLPVTVAGQSFDLAAIEAGRQSIEVKSRHLPVEGRRLTLYPLFNTDPERAIIPFPEKFLRLTPDGAEVVNADTNRPDPELSREYSAALTELGFVFPATAAGSKPTNLKPFDDGIFIRDANGAIFHLRRVLNRPEVVRTAIDPKLPVRHIVVAENRRREFHGLLITDHGVLLIGSDGYRPIPLAMREYSPERMDFALHIDPLHKTVVVTDRSRVRGVVMDSDYRQLRTFELDRVDPTAPVLLRLKSLLFPYQLTLSDLHHPQAAPRLIWGGWWSLAGLVGTVLAGLAIGRNRGRAVPAHLLALLAVTGLYGAIAISCLRGWAPSRAAAEPAAVAGGYTAVAGGQTVLP